MRSVSRRYAGVALDVAAQWSRSVVERMEDLERLARFQRGRLEFQSRPDDVWVVTYPRSGTTWMVYLLHLLLGGTDAFEHIEDVCPWFERSLARNLRTAEDLARLPSPRVFKSHLLPDWTPREGRFVHVYRDGFEVARSYYALYCDYLGYRDTFEAFLRRYMQGHVQYGSWFDHVGAWQREKTRKVIHVEYAQLRRHTNLELRRVALALGLEITEERLAMVCQQASLERMRKLQSRFDHATSIMRERGIKPGSFIGREHERSEHWRHEWEVVANAPPQGRRRLRDFLL